MQRLLPVGSHDVNSPADLQDVGVQVQGRRNFVELLAGADGIAPLQPAYAGYEMIAVWWSERR